MFFARDDDRAHVDACIARCVASSSMSMSPSVRERSHARVCMQARCLCALRIARSHRTTTSPMERLRRRAWVMVVLRTMSRGIATSRHHGIAASRHHEGRRARRSARASIVTTRTSGRWVRPWRLPCSRDAAMRTDGRRRARRCRRSFASWRSARASSARRRAGWPGPATSRCCIRRLLWRSGLGLASKWAPPPRCEAGLPVALAAARVPGWRPHPRSGFP